MATIGIIGLGRMGGNMAERMRRGGHTVVGLRPDPGQRPRRRASLQELVAALATPRVGLGDGAGRAADPARPSPRSGSARARRCRHRRRQLQVHRRPAATRPRSAEKGIGFVDCGVSGGVWGLTEGYALMAGGTDENVAQLQPIFDTLKPEGESGFVHAGDGRRRALRQDGSQRHRVRDDAGLRRGLGAARRPTDLVTDVPGHHRVLAEGHRRPVLAARPAVRAPWTSDDAPVASCEGYAQDSGEGRWTVEAAIDHAVPLPVITAALFARFASPAGGLAGDEGRGGAARPVRRSRDHGCRRGSGPGIGRRQHRRFDVLTFPARSSLPPRCTCLRFR